MKKHRKSKSARHRRSQDEAQQSRQVKEEICMNCGTVLHGPYCSNCGQKVTDLNQSFWSFLMEYLANAFQLDTRLLPTLKEMAIHPGRLTQEFFKGKINSYVHPLKMNMFMLVIVIAIVALFMRPSTNIADDQTNAVLSSDLNSLIQTYLPIFILLMTPVLGLVVQLFNLRKKRPFMEHFVFALHFAAFMEMFIVLKMVVTHFCNNAWIDFAFYAVSVLYLMLSLRRVYAGTGWTGAFFKSLAIVFFYFAAMVVAIVLVALLFVYKNHDKLEDLASYLMQ